MSSNYNDAELDEPKILTNERLVEIIRQCLDKWEMFPSIPGSRRWFRNGGIALDELARRASVAESKVKELEARVKELEPKPSYKLPVSDYRVEHG